MSFGFSVGDFLAAACLIEQTVSALREAGGSSSQFRRLVLELHALGRALQEVDRLEPAHGLEGTVEAIKAAALSCQLPLREFLDNIKKYDKSLGLGQSAGIMKDVLHKVKWIVSKKQEAALKFQAEMAAYLGGINLLLGLYQVKVNALAERKARQRFESLNTTLRCIQKRTSTIVEDVAAVKYQVGEGTRAAREDIYQSSKQTSQALQRFHESCLGTMTEFLKQAGSLSQLTLQTYTKVTDMYNILLSLRGRLPGPDLRPTWFQDPMRFEDAYGRLWPVPVEFGYPMMEGALGGKFQSGRGKTLVEQNQWQLFDSTNVLHLFTPANWEPFPGMKVTMAMIIHQQDDRMQCPRLGCASSTYKDADGGGKNCAVCGTWVDTIQDPATSIVPQDSTLSTAESEVDISSSIEFGYEPDKAARRALTGGDETPNLPIYNDFNSEDLRLLKHARIKPFWQVLRELAALARRTAEKARFPPGELLDRMDHDLKALSHYLEIIWKLTLCLDILGLPQFIPGRLRILKSSSILLSMKSVMERMQA